MKDNYEFWFRVFSDGTTAKTVNLKANVGKFVASFPDQYLFHPTVAAVESSAPRVWNAGLY